MLFIYKNRYRIMDIIIKISTFKEFIVKIFVSKQSY